MGKVKYPVTPAIRALKASGFTFEQHLYDYVERGGTAASAAALGVQEHAVIKTLVLEDEKANPLLALMHGDAEVSLKALARHLGVKSITPCEVATANRHSGYQVGGTSPFATRRAMPVYMQETILKLDKLYINGGKRGFLISMAPADTATLLKAHPLKITA